MFNKIDKPLYKKGNVIKFFDVSDKEVVEDEIIEVTYDDGWVYETIDHYNLREDVIIGLVDIKPEKLYVTNVVYSNVDNGKFKCGDVVECELSDVDKVYEKMRSEFDEAYERSMSEDHPCVCDEIDCDCEEEEAMLGRIKAHFDLVDTMYDAEDEIDCDCDEEDEEIESITITINLR